MGEGCLDIANELSNIVQKNMIKEGCDCLIFSGGIDTTFIALSTLGLKEKMITVSLPGSKDLYFVNYLIKKLKLNTSIYKSSKVLSEEVSECLDVALRSLKVIDPIEIISGITVCLALKRAKKLGCNCVATGDGGDELFFGYNFLLDKDETYLRKWLEFVVNGAFFNSIPISSYIGIKSFLPLYSKEAKEISLRTPIGCKINYINGRRYGKYLLRKWILYHGIEKIALREKTPITFGSGSQGLLDLWKEKVSLEDLKKLSKEYHINFPSRAHAYLFIRGKEMGLFNENNEKRTENTCPVCGFPLINNHCKFCGAYIYNNRVYVYRDF